MLDLETIDLPMGWISVSLGDIGVIVTGRTPPGGDPLYYGGTTPFLTPTDMQGGRDIYTSERLLSERGRSAIERVLVPAGSVAVSCIGSQLGKTAFTRVELATNQQINTIIPAPSCDGLYIYYMLSSQQDYIRGVASGSAVPIVNKSTFSGLKILLPPLEEQRAIAEVLGALDDKIELNRQMNHTLDEMASALFKSWFVDFDPVVAKAEGSRPYGMDDATAALFPVEFVESIEGSVPLGWRWSTIGTETKVVGGSTPSTNVEAYWAGGTHAWCTPKDLSGLRDQVVLSTERRITDAGVRQISSGLLPAGAVLLSSRAPIGYTAIAEVPLAINQGFIAMICEGALPNHYVLRWTRQSMEEISGRAGGTTFAEISKQAFRPIPVLVPAPTVLRAYESRVVPWHDLVVSNIRESSTLAGLRDSLLPQLLSGEIRLKDAEKAVSEVL
jgi:type I restriction enzyme S subunit